MALVLVHDDAGGSKQPNWMTVSEFDREASPYDG
jgi:hypothetical protein